MSNKRLEMARKRWDLARETGGKGVPAGVYYARLQSLKFTASDDQDRDDYVRREWLITAGAYSGMVLSDFMNLGDVGIEFMFRFLKVCDFDVPSYDELADTLAAILDEDMLFRVEVKYNKGYCNIDAKSVVDADEVDEEEDSTEEEDEDFEDEEGEEEDIEEEEDSTEEEDEDEDEDEDLRLELLAFAQAMEVEDVTEDSSLSELTEVLGQYEWDAKTLVDNEVEALTRAGILEAPPKPKPKPKKKAAPKAAKPKRKARPKRRNR